MDKQQQREVLLDNGDLLKLSLAGLLRDYEIQTWRGEAKLGKQMFYGPQIAGYCTQPWENVNYASCHDGETLFDQVTIVAKIPFYFLLPVIMTWSAYHEHTIDDKFK